MEMEQSKKYFWVLLDLALVAFLVNLVFFVMPTIKKFGDSFTPARTLTVSAEGRTFVAPDIAMTSFSVISEGQNPSALADDNNKKITAAINFVKSEGIDAKDVQTSGYNLSPRYEYDEDRRTSFVSGYTLTQTVTLKVRNFDKIASLLAGLPPLGINQIGRLNFTVDEPEKFLREARAEAFQKARAKAEHMARQNNIRLGRVLNVGESPGGFPIPYAQLEKGGAGFGGDVTPPTIEPGTQELVIQVSVTYSLE